MVQEQNFNPIRAHWERPDLGQIILDELASEGKDLNNLTIADLDPYDQFHGGGKGMTILLAQAAEIQPGMRILDVGGGLGGPARTLAADYGCDVTVADLTESYLDAGRLLTLKLHLESRVRFMHADALNLPFADSQFDMIWTQNSGMNIADKKRLYLEFNRVLRPGGVLAFQEPMLGIHQPMQFPVMWAESAQTSFLKYPGEMKVIIESAGFEVDHWQDVSAELDSNRRKYGFRDRGIQVLVMGDRLEEITRASKQNADEQRVVLIQGVCRKSTDTPTKFGAL